MSKFKIAHIRKSGQDMIIVLLNPSFGRQSNEAQATLMDALQVAANDAGLAGTVAAIWSDGRTVGFRAPPPWHPYFRTPGIYQHVMHNINRELILAA